MSILVNSSGAWKDATGGGTSMTSGTGQRKYGTYSYSCKWYKIGRMVFVVLSYTFGSNRDETEGKPATFTGLPQPITEWYSCAGDSEGMTSGIQREVTLSTRGELVVVNSGYGKYVCDSFAYISKS